MAGLLAAVLLAAVAGERVRGLLASSAQLASLSVAIALPLGLLLALLLAKTDTPGRRPALLLLVAGMFTPLHFVAAGWDAALGVSGVLTPWLALAASDGLSSAPLIAGWRGAVWVHAMAATPWVAMIAAAGLWSVDAELEEDALLDAPPHRVLRRITLPLAAGALAAGALWAAAVAASEMTVTDLYQVRTFAEEVYTQAALGSLDFTATPDAALPPGAVRGRLALAGGVGLVALGAFASLMLVRRSVRVDATAERRPAWRAELGRWRPLGAATLAMLMLLVVGVPVAALASNAGTEVVPAGDTVQRQRSATKLIGAIAAAPWQHRRELTQSTLVGAAAATSAVVFGALAAWRLRRGVAPLTTALMAFALAIPGPLLGLAIIRLLNQPTDSPVWWLAWLYDHTQTGPWIAQTVRATPIAALVLWPPLASVPQSALDAARLEGAGPLRRLWGVAAPMRLGAFAAAWLAALAVALGELAATVLVAPPGTPPLAVRVFSLLHYGVEDRVAAICLVLMLGYTAMAAAAIVLWRRSMAGGV
ncbi:putrescine transporter subunit: membrane component of ABC superfamily protein [Pseudobythopirellula maris]|uniref:Putrescine transporter subunit: membrane component of ABC superfamily protein n=2 Tax=Pseudobythopirellula maris TaxID=2527991 RepID=A0A5C5ZJ16_9BACT|nr:putrescine transporter subunit: membrane component of ABC superfamily protein [Pseudobythopirellula maris]